MSRFYANFSVNVVKDLYYYAEPVLSVWLNSEQTFGFIEFRSVQDTNLALQHLKVTTRWQTVTVWTTGRL